MRAEVITSMYLHSTYSVLEKTNPLALRLHDTVPESWRHTHCPVELIVGTPLN